MTAKKLWFMLYETAIRKGHGKSCVSGVWIVFLRTTYPHLFLDTMNRKGLWSSMAYPDGAALILSLIESAAPIIMADGHQEIIWITLTSRGP